MKHMIQMVGALSLVMIPWVASAADSTAPVVVPPDWHAHTLGQALMHMALFALVGVVLAVAGYKFFDLVTPGHMHKEIFENKNVAAAIVGAAIILGVCILVAAAMVG